MALSPQTHYEHEHGHEHKHAHEHGYGYGHSHGHRHCETLSHGSRISWSAIFVGAIASIGLSFLFNSFALGIGLTAFREGAEGLSGIGFIWMIITAIITMFIAGLIAGWIASFRCAKTSNGILHGFLAWCAGLILMLILISHVGMLTTKDSQLLSLFRLNANMPGAAVFDVSTIAMVTFVLFLVGAIASCIGGWVGIHCRCHRRHGDTTTTTTTTGPTTAI